MKGWPAAGRSRAPHGSAMDGLAGVLGLLVYVHQKAKEIHQRDEELTVESLECFVGVEEQGKKLAACGSLFSTSAGSETEEDGS